MASTSGTDVVRVLVAANKAAVANAAAKFLNANNYKGEAAEHARVERYHGTDGDLPPLQPSPASPRTA